MVQKKKNICLFSFPVEIALVIAAAVNRYMELMTMFILLSSKWTELNGKMHTDKKKTMQG